MTKIKVLGWLLLLWPQLAFAQDNTESILTLSSKERSIILISAFTAIGDMRNLDSALNKGLNDGLTISENKEIIIQLYAYAGFPRSLNALHTLMAVLEERRSKGIRDVEGNNPSPYPLHKTILQLGTENQTKLTGTKIGGGVYEFAPAIDQFLKEHLFGHIFGRNNLDWRTRELVTISALAAMKGVTPQLRSHFNVGMHNGLTINQLSELVSVIEKDIDRQQASVARKVLQSVMDKTPYVEKESPMDMIFPRGEQITNDNFLGNAWLNQLIQTDSANSIQVGNVTFEPGARTKWHYHPAGQILLALDGVGYYQEKGSPKRLLRKGEVVRCPPNVPHWHGASPGELFVQVAISDSRNGATVWLEAVSDTEYNSNL